MTQRYEKIWLSTDERIQVLAKWIVIGRVYDDIGLLQSNARKLKFQGKKHQMAISDVHTLSLFHLKPQKIVQNTIVALLIGLLVFALSFAVISTVWFYHHRSFTSLWPSLFAILEIELLILVGLCTFMLMFHFSSKGPLGSSWWVKVEYPDKQNNQQIVYFADGSWKGWGGILGRTHHMYASLQQEFPTQLKK